MSILAALPFVASSVASIFGAKRQNDANSAQAAREMQFEADQATRQMEFQKEMSNTAYQRAAADLEKAGLNRILALGSPASTPGGAAGSGSSAKMENIMGGASQQLKEYFETNLTKEMVNTEITKQELNRANAKMAGGYVGFPGFFKAPISSAKQLGREGAKTLIQQREKLVGKNGVKNIVQFQRDAYQRRMQFFNMQPKAA